MYSLRVLVPGVEGQYLLSRAESEVLARLAETTGTRTLNEYPALRFPVIGFLV